MTEEIQSLLKIFEASSTPLTAQKIRKKMHTYPATALRRVLALQVELKRVGAKKQIRETTLREGRRGPPSRAWVLM